MEELNPLGSLANQTSAIQTINENYDKIEDGFEDTLSRTTGGAMQVPLDMNGNGIINLGPPVSSNDAARWVDVQEALTPEGVLIPSQTGNAGKYLQTNGTTLAWTAVTGNYVLRGNNGSDFTNIPLVRTNLGLGTMAVENVTSFARLSDAATRTGTSTFNNAVTFGGTADHRITGTFMTLTPESIGFRGVPTTPQDSNYTFVLNDSGQCRLHTSLSAHTFYVPSDTDVSYPTGTVLMVDNIGSGAVALVRNAGVALRREGSATNKDFSLAEWGVAVLRKRGPNSWVISGTNLT